MTNMRNQMKVKWERGEPVFGGWCSTGSPVVAELLALGGFDYVCFDLQHGLMGYDTFLSCLYSVARTPATPIARVPSNDVGWIGKVLDAGAQGVIIPMVNSREDAELAVANCRLFPEGHRSFGPIRLGQTFGRNPETLNREVACIVMIETAAGVENAAAICAVPGVDGVYVGPADLALTYGLVPSVDPQAGPHADGIEAIRKACADNGIVAGIHCGSGESARSMADAGFTMMSIGSDVLFLQAGAKDALEPAGGAKGAV